MVTANNKAANQAKKRGPEGPRLSVL